jgi:diguanylate cyclase (GGDEF)-like protein/PAS domain S-box-containing protein
MMTQRAFHYARSLLEASLDPVAAINADGQITDVNQAAVMATGVERDELIGTDFSSYFTEPHKARKTYQEVFAQGTVRDHPLILRHRSGATIDVLYNASVYHDQNNEVAGVLAVARDITQLRRSQLELQQKNHEILLLADLNNLLQSCNVTGEAFPIIVAAMQKLFPDSTGRCFMLEQDKYQLIRHGQWGSWPDDLLYIPAGDCWALRLGRMHEVGFSESINPACSSIDEKAKPYLCIPLLALGQSLGILQLIPAKQSLSSPLTEQFINLAQAAADSISLVLANLRLRETLQALSVRDPLTGLYNRRFMEETLLREMNHMTRIGKTMAVAMLDLDHFKQVNDVYGHEAGDLVLKEVARLMQDFREGSDVACRYGGEEFVLVMPAVSAEQARQRFDHLRDSVSKLRLHLDDETYLPAVTISIGFAMYPSDGRHGDDLLRQADAALYRAKDGGRNQVVAAAAAVEDGS